MGIPDKTLVRPLEEGQVGKLGLGLGEVVLLLEGAGEVVAVGEEEARGGQHSPYHGHVLLVVTLLAGEWGGGVKGRREVVNVKEGKMHKKNKIKPNYM